MPAYLYVAGIPPGEGLRGAMKLDRLRLSGRQSCSTCHEAVHMEERHYKERSVPLCELICCSDVVQAGCQVGMRQRYTLRL